MDIQRKLLNYKMTVNIQWKNWTHSLGQSHQTTDLFPSTWESHQCSKLGKEHPASLSLAFREKKKKITTLISVTHTQNKQKKQKNTHTHSTHHQNQQTQTSRFPHIHFPQEEKRDTYIYNKFWNRELAWTRNTMSITVGYLPKAQIYSYFYTHTRIFSIAFLEGSF